MACGAGVMWLSALVSNYAVSRLKRASVTLGVKTPVATISPRDCRDDVEDEEAVWRPQLS